MSALDSDSGFEGVFGATAAEFGCVRTRDAGPSTADDAPGSADGVAAFVDFCRSRHYFGCDLRNWLFGAVVRDASDFDSPADGADGGAKHSYCCVSR